MDQKSHSSALTQPGKTIPIKWQERFIIKRIDEANIEISLAERDGILRAMNIGQRFVQVRKYTLMVNTIKSIDPLWGDDNIPPRPTEVLDYVKTNKENTLLEVVLNQEELDEWDSFFKEAYDKAAKARYRGVSGQSLGTGKNTDSERLPGVREIGPTSTNSIETIVG